MNSQKSFMFWGLLLLSMTLEWSGSSCWFPPPSKGTREYMHNMEKELSSLRKKYLEQKDPVVQQLQVLVDSFTKSQQQILQANQELIQRTVSQQMDAYQATVQVVWGMYWLKGINCVFNLNNQLAILVW